MTVVVVLGRVLGVVEVLIGFSGCDGAMRGSSRGHFRRRRFQERERGRVL